MKLISQDRDLTITVYKEEEKYWGEEVYYDTMYFGTNLWMSTGMDDRIFLGTFENQEEIQSEIWKIKNCNDEIYLISKPELFI